MLIFSYTILLNSQGDDDKLIPMIEYFYYYALPGDAIVAINANDQKYQVSSLGMEMDYSLRYVF